MLAPAVAWGAPPPLPEGDAAPADAPAPDPAPDAGADLGTDAGADAGLDAGADASLEADAGFEADAGLGEDSDAFAEFDDSGFEEDFEAADDSEEDVGAMEGEDDDDPGNVQGRREPLMPTNRGAIGLFHTALPDVGGKYTVRFRLHTDFFRKDGFIYEGPEGPDQQARVQGGVTLGFSPAKWGEIFFSVNSAANRNTRQQAERQDAEAIFALGDIDFGFKGAWRFKKGIGVGGQVGVGLLSGSSRLLTQSVNVWFDGLFAADLRYMTKSQFPARFTANVGWMLDNSLRVGNYDQIDDPISREVTRFSLGGNQSRVRMRYAVDFPFRLGKERKFGLDPILEWAWDVTTTEEPAFARPDATASPLPRSSQWITVGMRANVISGLHIDAAADVGVVSPNFEFGPPTPPWQIILGLGWSFDPMPIIKEVPVEAEAPPPPPAPEPIIEGRIIGAITDAAGAPVPSAVVMFPGLVSGGVVSDVSGNFTSYRFPAGAVAFQVVMDGQVVHEGSADIVAGEDTQVQVQLETGPPAVGVIRGAFTDESGKAVVVTMQVVGQGVDEPFNSLPDGQIALELDEGEYRATATAAGYKSNTFSFTVQPGGDTSFAQVMVLDAAPETPLVSANDKSIRLKRRIRYDKKNQVTSQSYEVLDQLATFLKYHPEYAVIEIGTHTDDNGAAKTRTDERADSVRSYLTGKGIEGGRIKTKGYGASKPVAVNLTAAGRAKNNRTTIRVVTKN